MIDKIIEWVAVFLTAGIFLACIGYILVGTNQ